MNMLIIEAMEMKNQIYSREEIDALIDAEMSEDTAKQIKGFLDWKDSRIDFLNRKVDIACGLIGENVVAESMEWQ